MWLLRLVTLCIVFVSASQSVAEKLYTSETVISETVTSETVISETVTSETVTSETLTSEPLTLEKRELPYEKFDNLPWVTINDTTLTLDIYQPLSSKNKPAPVVVIYHGGAWLIGDERGMDQMADYFAREGYVVANMNYRLLVENNNQITLNQVIEDAFGGLLWVKHHIGEYGGDVNKIAVTGDSAGGHLASMILNAGRNLSSTGFDQQPVGYNPTWLPPGKNAEQVAKEGGLGVQAAVISYGVLDVVTVAQHGFETDANIFWQMAQVQARGVLGDQFNVEDHLSYYKALSPQQTIPTAKQYRLPPQFHHVGSVDTTTTPESIQAYVNALKAAGQEVALTIYPGNNHAYMNSGCIEFFKSCFESHAVPVMKETVEYLDGILK